MVLTPIFIISDLSLAEWRSLQPGRDGHEARLLPPGDHGPREDSGAGARAQGADTQGGPLRPLESLGSLSQKQGIIAMTLTVKIRQCNLITRTDY